VEEFGEDLESDLLRFWNLDLVADLGTPRLTWRRLRILIERLPPESSVFRSVVGEEAALWTPDRHLLAGVLDRLGTTSYLLGGVLVTLGAVKENPVPEPRSLPRPGVDVAETEPANNRGLMTLAQKMGQPVKLS
jgi:hypothetical protein